MLRDPSLLRQQTTNNESMRDTPEKGNRYDGRLKTAKAIHIQITQRANQKT
jgi:hypothetical protein